MLKVRAETLREIEEAFRRYEDEVEGSPLARQAKDTYLLHSRNFVRWLKDEFTPGARLTGSR